MKAPSRIIAYSWLPRCGVNAMPDGPTAIVDARSLRLSTDVGDDVVAYVREDEAQETIAKAVAKERADLRAWLGQQAAKARASQAASPIANMSAFHEGAAGAFKAAANHLKPERKPSAKLLAKRAARK